MAYLTPKISATYNNELQFAVPVRSTTGTITQFSNQLYLQRIFIPGEMFLSEIDAALGISFNATSNGAGTMSRQVGIYSFGNSSSLQLVTIATATSATITASFSSTSAWTTGTSTVAGSTSITQFQGGWSNNVVSPLVISPAFTIQPGEYVIGMLFNFAQASSSWSVSLYGANYATITAANRAISAISNAGTAVQTIVTSSTSTKALTVFTVAPTAATISAITSIGTSLSIPIFGFVGTGSATSTLQNVFSAGIMATGAIPAAITLTSTNVTYTGTAALAQPWFGLIGA